MTGIGAQFHVRMIFQNLDCRGTRLQEGHAQRSVSMVSDNLLQIFSALAALSFAPTADAWRVLGIQIDPADSAEVPPINSVFSTSSVLAPRMAEKSAADRPAAPAPMTTTS